jgi:hypothetical protein
MSDKHLRRTVHQKQMRLMAAIAAQGAIAEAAKEYMAALSEYRVTLFSAALLTFRKPATVTAQFCAHDRAA